MAHDVFVSYASKDKTVADAVCARLEARGIRCWIAPRDVHPGLPYGEEIIDAIQTCRVMVLVFSSSANVSPHIPKEIERAVSQAIPVIPLRVENVTPGKSLDYFISSVHWLDAITPPLEQHLESLANTILAILPTKPEAGAQPGAPAAAVPVNAPRVTSAAAMPPTVSSKKKTGLFVGIGAAVVLAAAAGWYFWIRTPDTQGTQYPPYTQPYPQPQPGGPTAPRATGDPIVGCWTWFNNVPVIIKADGTAIGGPFTARWRRSSRRLYTLTWPEAVDVMTLSADGRTLQGGNQYGIATTATRLTPGMGAVGMWSWHGGAIVIQADGSFIAGPFRGSWRATGGNTYALTWPNPVDTLTMSPDLQRLSGSNQFGIKSSGTKMASCGG